MSRFSLSGRRPARLSPPEPRPPRLSRPVMASASPCLTTRFASRPAAPSLPIKRARATAWPRLLAFLDSLR